MMEAYYDVREPGSFGGVNALYRLMKSKGSRATKKQIVDWLAEQEAYNLHKPIRRRFPRRKIYSRGIDYLWQADLADMTHLADHNDGYRYLLTVIDVFSKYSFVTALKKKNAKSVTEAFERVLVGGRKPLKLQTDKGKEFVNDEFQKMLKSKGIQFFVSQNDDIKASVVERFNRTLKTKMWKYFTHRNTYKFIDVLQDMVYSYNHTHHRTIGRSPVDVTTGNAGEVWEKMYGDDEDRAVAREPKLKVGDKVRISKTRRVFGKGYLPNWTEEIFTVNEAIRTKPTTYKLADYDGEVLEGSFYDRELQKVTKTDDVYKVEHILRTRRRAGRKEYFVKWRGYPKKFNSWVDEADLTDAI
jgi:hypothetical protein